jgi:hypothetical protein
MSDWNFLNKHRVKLASRTVPECYISEDEDGFNGMFRFVADYKFVRCLASDGGGWQHVSVSVEEDRKPPSWGIMCRVKDLFWEDDETVVQYHPPKSVYVNFHPHCLHMWRYTGGGPFEIPVPHWFLVGPKMQP